MLVIHIDEFRCGSVLRCATAIIHGISEARSKAHSMRARRKLKKAGYGPESRDWSKRGDSSEPMEEVEYGGDTNEQDDEDHVNLDLLESTKIEDPVVIIITNTGKMKRTVLNDLIHMLVKSKQKNGNKFNLIMSMTGSIEPFHVGIDMQLIPYLKVKTITLPSIRDAILAIIAKYVLDYTFLIQPDENYLSWIYQQVMMYNISFNSFQKTFLYMNFTHIYNCPFFFMFRYFESKEMRMKYFEDMLRYVSKKDKKDFENRVMYVFLFVHTDSVWLIEFLGTVKTTKITQGGSNTRGSGRCILQPLRTTKNVFYLFCSWKASQNHRLINLYNLVEKIAFAAYPMQNVDRARSKLIVAFSSSRAKKNS